MRVDPALSPGHSWGRGMTDAAAARAPLSFWAGIQVDGDSFTFDPSGSPARVVPVRDAENTIFDAAAFLADRPGRWFLREREAVVLGERDLAGARLDGRGVQLYPTPSAWVAGAGQGCCILRWDVGLAPLFEGAGLINLSHLDETAAATMEQRLRENFELDLPRIAGTKGPRNVRAS